MKNWKTTLAGLVPGVLLAGNALIEAYSAGYFDGKTGKQLVVAIALFLIGWVAKDHDKSGTSKTDVQGIALPKPPRPPEE